MHGEDADSSLPSRGGGATHTGERTNAPNLGSWHRLTQIGIVAALVWGLSLGVALGVTLEAWRKGWLG